MKKEVIVAVSGYFDPIHVGHLEYLKLAKNLGDKLIVIMKFYSSPMPLLQ